MSAPTAQAILSDLARVKVLFQARTLEAVIRGGQHPSPVTNKQGEA